MEREGVGTRMEKERASAICLPLFCSLAPCDGTEEQGPLLFQVFCSAEVLTGWQAQVKRQTLRGAGAGERGVKRGVKAPHRAGESHLPVAGWAIGKKH